MDSNKEYHDPDYPVAAVRVKEEPVALSEDERIEKIKHIISREFSNELELRENEVMLLDQRLSTSRRLLCQLRYTIVSRYYSDQKLQPSSAQIQDEIAAQKDHKAQAEVSTILRGCQRKLHPSLRKLFGKKTVNMDEIFSTRGPRNKKRPDYSAMINSRNYTISADATKSLRPLAEPPAPPPPEAPPKKIPRRADPKLTNVLTVDEAIRSQTKHRYRIIIGNSSQYCPAASAADRSTHKWVLYVRAPPGLPAALTVTLHHSYSPHHVVHLPKPPYHIARRGWGEFPARLELHFPLPDRNRPATVDHHIKLDRNYTGMQMLGSETVVDVWLYSTPEMLPYACKEDTPDTEPIKPPEPTVITEIEDKQTDWMDFFKSPTTELDIDEMLIKPTKKINDIITDNDLLTNNDQMITDIDNIEIKQEILDPIESLPAEEMLPQPPTNKRIVKYIDPTTGKIYYLEMDKQLDLTKVQEIVINDKVSPVKSNGVKPIKKKTGVSLLKPLKCEKKWSHIENDHCYIASDSLESESTKCLYTELCSVVCRFVDVRSAVNYLVKRIPLISEQAKDRCFLKYFPFVVENSYKYWKLDFAKRRNIEWSRAKLINKILTENFTNGPIWRTKQILAYLRLHGHHPIREDYNQIQGPDWSNWNGVANIEKDTSIKEHYPNASDICTLTPFKFELDSSLNDTIELSDEEVDVLTCDVNVKVKKEVDVDSDECLTVLPVENEDDRLRFLYIERKCADIGIELRNEDIGGGYSYSAVHAVLLSAMRCFAEELIRGAIAADRLHEDPKAANRVWFRLPFPSILPSPLIQIAITLVHIILHLVHITLPLVHITLPLVHNILPCPYYPAVGPYYPP